MGNLRDRLKTIKEIRYQKTSHGVHEEHGEEVKDFDLKGWTSCGFKVVKSETVVPSPLKAIKNLPEALAILIPDLAGRSLPNIEDFLFFDLETSGLSGGAGTVAFLAAFGRIKNDKLRITQYLLLDYPGENDFLEAVLKEFKDEKSVIVSYNGKCFDSQIIKTRCLMNRIKQPVYFHADLLHPARRLWKNVIGDCSQASIETNILGLDRTCDIPGSMAPDIWFDFLKTGKTEMLLGICKHNCSDISGLAAILSAMVSIADAPLETGYRYDTERLALYWRDFVRRNDMQNEGLRTTGNDLMRYAVKKGNKRAVYVYAYDQTCLGNYKEALKLVNRGLELFEEGTEWHDRLLRKKERLEKKLNLN